MLLGGSRRPPGNRLSLEAPLGIFSFSGLEKRSLHLRAIDKGLFIASILGFHKTITFHHVLPLMILGSPPFVLDAPGRVGNLLAADLHRSIALSAAPPSSWPGRELRKYHCLEVPGGCLFTFQGPPASGLSSPLGDAVIKLHIKTILLGSNQLYPFSSDLGTLSTPFFESAHYNDNLGSSLTGVTICHSLL